MGVTDGRQDDAGTFTVRLSSIADSSPLAVPVTIFLSSLMATVIAHMIGDGQE